MRFPLRDKLLLVAGAVAALAVSGCGQAASPAAPGPAVAATAASTEARGGDASQLANVRRATAAFHDIDKAMAAGYASPAGGHCDASAAGAMGVHAANPALLQDIALNPEQPEVLLYLPSGGGNYRLVGVEYVQPVLLRDTATNRVAPWFAPTPWPASHVVVNPAPSLFGQTFQGPMPGHVPGMPWHYDLHVWAWAPNPSGTFAQWNPSISCN